MRFHLGAIPETPDFSPDDSWRALREPTPWGMQLLALPVGLTVAAVLVLCWFRFTPTAPPSVIIDRISLAAFIFSFAVIVVGHELIHVAVHPMAGRSSQSILGFWPVKLLFYAHYEGQLTRNRFVAILLMPFMVISVVPFFIAAITQVSCDWAFYVSCFNALLACGDILGVGLVLSQVPNTAVIRNQGWKSYWQETQLLHVAPDDPTVNPDISPQRHYDKEELRMKN